jgi:uncharacterized DUF497 family protein
MKMSMIFEWDEEKRQKIIKKRDLDIVAIAQIIFPSAETIILPDNRVDYGEKRFQAFAIVKEKQICLNFTFRGDVMRLITIFQVNKRYWRKHCGKNN